MEGSKLILASSGVRAMFDVANELRERFDFNAYWLQSAWEHDPAMEIINNTITGRDPLREAHEDRMIEIFERLRDTVDAVPEALISMTQELRSQIQPEQFEKIVVESIQAIGTGALPRNSTEFFEVLNRSLRSIA